jgi:hypothetical protein
MSEPELVPENLMFDQLAHRSCHRLCGGDQALLQRCLEETPGGGILPAGHSRCTAGYTVADRGMPSCVAFLRDLRTAIDRCRSLEIPCDPAIAPRLRTILTREYLRMLALPVAKLYPAIQ